MAGNTKPSLLRKRLNRTRWFWTIKNFVRYLAHPEPISRPFVDDRSELGLAEPVLISWPEDCPRPTVGLVRENNDPPYWTKYERFLRNNQFPFAYYEAHNSDWLAAADQFDVILWAAEGLKEREEQKRKTHILEKYCGKSCLPSFDTLMWNEDKIYQYEWLRLFGFPVIETFISYNYEQTIRAIPHLQYPLVTKTPTGAGSLGVELVRDARQARRIARQAFSLVGRATYWPFFRQKGFVYFQNFQPNEGYDLRVMVVGNRAFGFYRDVPKGDFRASGMGLERQEEIPEDAVRLAIQLTRKLDLLVASVDMLRDPDGGWHICEIGSNAEVDGPSELKIDGIPGAYVFDQSGEFHFEPCKLWLQELTLGEFFTRWLRLHPYGDQKIIQGEFI